jgi:hypothetical protein
MVRIISHAATACALGFVAATDIKRPVGPWSTFKNLPVTSFSVAAIFSQAKHGPTNPPLANCIGYWHHFVCHRHGNVDLAFGLRLGVRFWGHSGHAEIRNQCPIGGKADMAYCSANVR